jgi:hypothetical protein
VTITAALIYVMPLMTDYEQIVVAFPVTRQGTVSDARVAALTHRVFDRVPLAAAAGPRFRARIVNGARVEVAGVRSEIVFAPAN